MDTIFHGRIGATLADTIERNYRTSIPRKSFLYGNVKADLAPEYRLISHYKNQIDTVVYGWIEELSKADSSALRDKKFYQKLGVVIHFICDFFCTPHNTYFKKNFFKHEVYEQLQHYTQGNKLKVFAAQVDKEPLFTFFNAEALINYLEKLHKSYMSTRSTMGRDMVFALRASNVVCHSILNMILYKDEEFNLAVPLAY